MLFVVFEICMEMYIILFKNWKWVFKQLYQTGPRNADHGYEVSGFLPSSVISITFPTLMNYNIVDNLKRIMKMAQMVAFMAISKFVFHC